VSKIERIRRVPSEVNKDPTIQEIMDGLDGGLKLAVDYLTAIAKAPQPFIALGATLATFGALMGRRYASPTDLRTNVFGIGVGASTSGKDAPRKGLRHLLLTAVATNFLGGEEFASGQSVYSMLAEFPSRVCFLDEFGQMVGGMRGKGAPAHKADILPNMTKLFTSASEVMSGKEYAVQKGKDANKRVDLHCPHLCVFATTTAGEMWGAVDGGALKNGALARYLVFQTPNSNPPRNRHPASKHDIPAELLRLVGLILDDIEAHDYGGNIAEIGTDAREVPEGQRHPPRGGRMMATWCSPTPYTVPYGAGVQEFLDTLEDEQTAEIDRHMNGPRGEMMQAFIGRWWEHTVTVAMIRAVARDPHAPCIELRDVQWARTLTRHCLATAMRETEAHVSDSMSESNVKRLLDVVRKTGPAGINKTDLLRRTRFMDTKQRNSLVIDLVEGGEIIAAKVETAGRSTTVYTLAAGDGIEGALFAA
jgi:hypothetical protein